VALNEVECAREAGRTRTVESKNLILVVRSPLIRINLVLEMQDWLVERPDFIE
jgi:hypothetical protein